MKINTSESNLVRIFYFISTVMDILLCQLERNYNQEKKGKLVTQSLRLEDTSFWSRYTPAFNPDLEAHL